MNAVEFWTMVVALAALVSAGYAIWRNGRAQRDKFTEVKTELTNIKKEVSHEEYGLHALGQHINDFKVHCAQMSTGLQERIIALENTKRRARKKSSEL